MEVGEPVPQGGDDLGRLVGGQGGLGEVGDLGTGIDVQSGHVLGSLDQGHRRLAQGAGDLLVTLMADEDDLIVLGGKASGLMMDLGHQRASGVDDREVTTTSGFVADLGGHAVGGQDHHCSGWHLIELLHEDGTLALQVGHDVAVVHDLATDVDRGAEALDGPLYDLDGPLHAGAERAWRGEHDVVSAEGAGPALERRSHPPQ